MAQAAFNSEQQVCICLVTVWWSHSNQNRLDVFQDVCLNLMRYCLVRAAVQVTHHHGIQLLSTNFCEAMLVAATEHFIFCFSS